MQLSPVALPEPALQVAAGPDGSLLAVGRSARLWRAAPGTLALTEIADGVDGLTPLAMVAGRIAGRRNDGALWVLDSATVAPLRRITLGADEVFEDITQRRVSLDALDGLLTVISGPSGARLALIAADPQQAQALEIRASGEAIGTRNRWMSPSADGPHWMTVHTPHIGGLLHEYKLQGSPLVARRLRAGLSTHKLVSRVLDMGSWHEGRLLLPDQAGTTLLLLDSRHEGPAWPKPTCHRRRRWH